MLNKQTNNMKLSNLVGPKPKYSYCYEILIVKYARHFFWPNTWKLLYFSSHSLLKKKNSHSYNLAFDIFKALAQNDSYH